jgi:hypothetical protein
MTDYSIEKRRRFHARPLNDWIHDFGRGKRIVDAIVHDMDEILNANSHAIKKNLNYMYDFGLTHTPTAPYTYGTNNQYITVELK